MDVQSLGLQMTINYLAGISTSSTAFMAPSDAWLLNSHPPGDLYSSPEMPGAYASAQMSAAAAPMSELEVMMQLMSLSGQAVQLPPSMLDTQPQQYMMSPSVSPRCVG